MRVLIDECIDERFRNPLPEHDCQTTRYAGLAGLKNGELLIAAETAKFDVFLTVDQGIEYQQNLTGRNIAIIIFRTKSNRLKDLLPHARACLAYIESILAAVVYKVPQDREEVPLDCITTQFWFLLYGGGEGD